MNRPITLYLIGFAGTGKYTIAKELAKHGYKVIDNHLINNPIFSLWFCLDCDPNQQATSCSTHYAFSVSPEALNRCLSEFSAQEPLYLKKTPHQEILIRFLIRETFQ